MEPNKRYPVNPFLTLEPGLVIDLTKANKCSSPKVTQSAEVIVKGYPIASPRKVTQSAEVMVEENRIAASQKVTQSAEVIKEYPVASPRKVTQSAEVMVEENRIAASRKVTQSTEVIKEYSVASPRKVTQSAEVMVEENRITASRKVTQSTEVTVKENPIASSPTAKESPDVIFKPKATPNETKKFGPGSQSWSGKPQNFTSNKPSGNSRQMKKVSNLFRNPVRNYGKTRLEKDLDRQLGLTLLGCDLEKYHDNFKRHHVSYLDFLRMSNEDLIDIGIQNLEDRKKLRLKIKEISETAFPDREAIPPRIRSQLLDPNRVGMMSNNVKHLKQMVGDVKDEKNCGITEVMELVKKNPSSLQDDSILNPVGVVIDAIKEVDKGCHRLDKRAEELRAQYQNRRSNILNKPGPQETPTSVRIRNAERRIVERRNTSSNFREPGIVAVTTIMIACVGTLAFFGLKKIIQN